MLCFKTWILASTSHRRDQIKGRPLKEGLTSPCSSWLLWTAWKAWPQTLQSLHLQLQPKGKPWVARKCYKDAKCLQTDEGTNDGHTTEVWQAQLQVTGSPQMCLLSSEPCEQSGWVCIVSLSLSRQHNAGPLKEHKRWPELGGFTCVLLLLLRISAVFLCCSDSCELNVQLFYFLWQLTVRPKQLGKHFGVSLSAFLQ